MSWANKDPEKQLGTNIFCERRRIFYIPNSLSCATLHSFLLAVFSAPTRGVGGTKNSNKNLTSPGRNASFHVDLLCGLCSHRRCQECQNILTLPRRNASFHVILVGRACIMYNTSCIILGDAWTRPTRITANAEHARTGPPLQRTWSCISVVK